MRSSLGKDVLFCHDGSADDFMALTLLAVIPDINLIGVVVTDGDCHIQAAAEVSRKILGLTGLAHVPVALSDARPLHAFPAEWRLDSLRINSMPIINHPGLPLAPISEKSGRVFVADVIRNNSRPVTVIDVGPATNLAQTLRSFPDVAEHIQQVIWMGGALKVAGNVYPHHQPLHNGTAEWNVYWDPEAAMTVLESGLRITLCPLDLTDQVPVNPGFMTFLTRHRHFAMADFAGQCYALNAYRTYSVWDVLTASYFLWPDIFETRHTQISVVRQGMEQGRTIEDKGGHSVHVLTEVDHAQFWSRLGQAFLVHGGQYE
ncbi:putative Inosine/uridine-preferring nucleoside hydrolase [Vibrio nigripulchritudo SFn27]|uniref:Inosine/uridine-preferring nucleoside hydrolase n=1 Tax=Vibrio nigripulchritudo TaxID=28173 RepID=A0A9P1JLB6_9VIBR|nr:nucleoside hydrolase [Vibrio nigripulchritudo]CBJ93188.1 Putative Inosine/uridine-preferring nucleoside hydrolase [Vibrio nigripulchritudo]CCN38708.1 putative Inosine/uridine-preferring nucleoside hydrolase [Vibrio nigripulchritudo AM115]CCN45016.1 putative Inosine/uridine-preferring nucleoside hydrolase [Vibrio nigripulchritudo FTn2]CCN79774.1 putative Inosine/uridine-preferring nucleoside hydrolase [Vibrio nigripulchritudo SO65]CCN91998.1 putative Inosine/uridine-preferring nucleoside hyd